MEVNDKDTRTAKALNELSAAIKEKGISMRHVLYAAHYIEEYPLSKRFYDFTDLKQERPLTVDYKKGTITSPSAASSPSKEMDIVTFIKNGPLEFDCSSPNKELHENISLIKDYLIDYALKHPDIDPALIDYTPAEDMQNWKTSNTILNVLEGFKLTTNDIERISDSFGLLKHYGTSNMAIAYTERVKDGYEKINLSAYTEYYRGVMRNPLGSQGVFYKFIKADKPSSIPPAKEAHVFETIMEALAWAKVNRHKLADLTCLVSTEGWPSVTQAKDISRNLKQIPIIVHPPRQRDIDRSQSFIDYLKNEAGAKVTPPCSWFWESEKLLPETLSAAAREIGDYLKTLKNINNLSSGSTSCLDYEFRTSDGVNEEKLTERINDIKELLDRDLIAEEKVRRNNAIMSEKAENDRLRSEFLKNFNDEGTECTFLNGEKRVIHYDENSDEIKLLSSPGSNKDSKDIAIKYDYSESYDNNRSRLFDAFYEEHPELLEDEIEVSRATGR